jgi:hypothetical protein
MKNYSNDGQQKADCENCGDTITVSSLQERNIAVDWGLTGRNYGGQLLLTLVAITQ